MNDQEKQRLFGLTEGWFYLFYLLVVFSILGILKILGIYD